jgi:hypothetical protein
MALWKYETLCFVCDVTHGFFNFGVMRVLVSQLTTITRSTMTDLLLPDLMDDYYLNLVDWSETNWLAIAPGADCFPLERGHRRHSEAVDL